MDIKLLLLSPITLCWLLPSGPPRLVSTMPKRDRWSSDDEEEDGGKASSTNRAVAAKGTAEDEGPKPAETRASAPHPGFRVHNPLLHGCRSVYDSYERISHLDEGTYGVVWKAKDNSTGEIVALKQIKFDSEVRPTLIAERVAFQHYSLYFLPLI